MDIAFGVANGVLQASDNVDDVVVVARGDHSRPGGVLIVRIAFRVIRQKAHVNPFAFASHFSGEALQVTIAVAMMKGWPGVGGIGLEVSPPQVSKLLPSPR